MVTKPIKVERHGWYVTIEIQEVSKRPNWEIRVRIIRSKEGKTERRGHRFHLSPELTEKLQVDGWSDAKRREMFARGAKKVILREFGEIFSEPEGGLDSLRPLNEADLSS